MFPDSKSAMGKRTKKITLGIPISVTKKADADPGIHYGFQTKFSSTDMGLEYFDLYSQVITYPEFRRNQ